MCALATGNPTIATAAALELPRMLLEDALALVLLYHRAGDRRFERAALRFHARLCAELPSVSLTGAAAALQASRRWAAATRVAAPRSSPRSSRPSASTSRGRAR